MEVYGFVRRDVNSSVYKAVSAYLLEERCDDWKKLPATSVSFQLMFGERNKLPFGRLGKKDYKLYCRQIYVIHNTVYCILTLQLLNSEINTIYAQI